MIKGAGSIIQMSDVTIDMVSDAFFSEFLLNIDSQCKPESFSSMVG
jgi:hypothetical protein